MGSTIHRLRAVCGEEDGASLAEYTLLIAFIATVCVVAVRALGPVITALFASIDGLF